ncbi:unnamed protein product [Polarella glacialis]|uniref:Uncharacterized protein n=1 Tax=Polarella glacialis TaxID=89957 RepID=A0A813DQJ7_POLGL|nr:unnamed protein product [Polarella glacialis]CAE8743452.1 unnamed protein product [Polarella glacialis]
MGAPRINRTLLCPLLLFLGLARFGLNGFAYMTGAQRGVWPQVPQESYIQHRSHHGRTGVAATATAASGNEASWSLFNNLFARDQRPVVLYDGVCNMCNRAVDVALDKDPEGKRLRFSALQSEVGKLLLVLCGRAAEDLSSMIVVKPDGTCVVQSDAALFVGQQLEGSPLLKGASEVAQRLLPKGLRDVVYNQVADNRYSVLGKRAEMRLGEDSDRFLSSAAAAR